MQHDKRKALVWGQVLRYQKLETWKYFPDLGITFEFFMSTDGVTANLKFRRPRKVHNAMSHIYIVEQFPKDSPCQFNERKNLPVVLTTKKYWRQKRPVLQGVYKVSHSLPPN